VLIDTSVWIEYLRRRGSSEAKVLVGELLEKRQAIYTDPVLYELLLGASQKETAWIQSMFSHLDHIPFTLPHWEAAAQTGKQLRSQGLNLPLLDIFIATLATSNNVPLLCRDKHFDLIKDVGGLSFDLVQLG